MKTVDICLFLVPLVDRTHDVALEGSGRFFCLSWLFSARVPVCRTGLLDFFRLTKSLFWFSDELHDRWTSMPWLALTMKVDYIYLESQKKGSRTSAGRWKVNNPVKPVPQSLVVRLADRLSLLAFVSCGLSPVWVVMVWCCCLCNSEGNCGWKWELPLLPRLQNPLKLLIMTAI